jgi:hypothetical protein
MAKTSDNGLRSADDKKFLGHTDNTKLARNPTKSELNIFIKDRYLDYKKDMKARGEKPMSFSDYKKPFMKVPIINIDIFKK